jgi:hypothetical protein
VNKFEKQRANRDARIEGKKEVANPEPQSKAGKKGKKSNVKSCPGYLDHDGKRRVALTVSCETCKRRFCSQECVDSHAEFCRAKLYYNKTGDVGPLLELSKTTYDKYVDENGEVKEFFDHKGDRISQWMLPYHYGDYEEAKNVLRKHEKGYMRGRHGIGFW